MDYDVIVVGSGFGGSVAALRTSEKGHRVAVLEMGRRVSTEDIEKANRSPLDLFWMPALGLKGFFTQTFFCSTSSTQEYIHSQAFSSRGSSWMASLRSAIAAVFSPDLIICTAVISFSDAIASPKSSNSPSQVTWYRHFTPFPRADSG